MKFGGGQLYTDFGDILQLMQYHGVFGFKWKYLTMLWFKNLYIYRLTRDINLDPEHLESQLAAFRFVPCQSQELQKFGWTSALGKHGQMFTHVAGKHVLICARKEQKMLPSSVIKESLSAKVEKLEQAQGGRALSKKEKSNLKDEIMVDLLPRAFSRFSQTYALIMPELKLILVDSGSSKKAEELLALLRKSLGSLPVVPVETEQMPSSAMTQWVRDHHAPQGFALGDEAELKAEAEQGGVIRCKQQDLTCDEILVHLDAGKYVTKLGLDWQQRVQFTLADDGALKKISFSDEIKDQNADIDNEEIAQRLDADLALLSGELHLLLTELFAQLGGIKNNG